MKKIVIDSSILTSPERVLFPKAGITKEDLGNYYMMIAPLMLPFLKDRPLTMQRFPEGISGEGFYQKDIPSYFPEWIERFPVRNSDNSITTYIVCQNKETLLYLAYQACITVHLFQAKIDKPLYPDRIIFDLDPGEHTTFDMVRATAFFIKGKLEERGITSFPMTTGSRGIHVVAPLRRVKDYDFVHRYALDFAKECAALHPKELTVEIRKVARKGRLFIDALRNTYGHLSVAPYAVRPKPEASIATPLTWEEVAESSLTPTKYTIKNIRDRLNKVGNVWEDFSHIKNSLT